jgi:hypothetical protein
MNSSFTQIFQTLFAALLSGCVLLSCEKDDKVKMPYRHGVFIVNEGAYTGNNGSVSFFSDEQVTVYNDIFYIANNRVLGDVVQSMMFHNGKAYIVVNNSNKVEVVDTPYFTSCGVIENVLSPRYMIAFGNNGYLTCWGDNTVKVIDLESYAIINSVEVGSGPEKMCIAGNKLYVANTGGWSTDSIITVINLETHEVIKNIVVRYTPTDLVTDSENNLWVLTYGKVVYGTEDPYPILEESPSKLFHIDSDNDSVLNEILLYENQHPAQLEINSEGELFFGGGYTFNGIYRLKPNDLTVEFLINEFAYGLNIDPVTSDIYITLAPSYSSAGTFKKYSSQGNLLIESECGIGPNSIVF